MATEADLQAAADKIGNFLIAKYPFANFVALVFTTTGQEEYPMCAVRAKRTFQVPGMRFGAQSFGTGRSWEAVAPPER